MLYNLSILFSLAKYRANIRQRRYRKSAKAPGGIAAIFRSKGIPHILDQRHIMIIADAADSVVVAGQAKYIADYNGFRKLIPIAYTLSDSVIKAKWIDIKTVWVYIHSQRKSARPHYRCTHIWRRESAAQHLFSRHHTSGYQGYTNPLLHTIGKHASSRAYSAAQFLRNLIGLIAYRLLCAAQNLRWGIFYRYPGGHISHSWNFLQ